MPSSSVSSRVFLVDRQTALHFQVVLRESAVSGIACPQIMNAPGPGAGPDRLLDSWAILTRNLTVQQLHKGFPGHAAALH
jgi:hypothetical protein